MTRRIIAIFTATIAITTATAQELTYEQYMQRVTENNTALVAHSIDIDIAKAAVKASKTYNDPELSVEYGNNEDWNKDLGQSIATQLGGTFTFGVRRSGIRLAEKELQATIAVFNDYMRNFHAEATIAYLEHLKAKALLTTAIKRETYMTQLAHNDSLRFVRGDIAKTQWIESRLAAGLTRNERLAAETHERNTAIRLGYFMGELNDAGNIKAAGNLEENHQPLLSIEEYVEKAMENRADLHAALSNVDIAKAQQKLNSAKRRIDLKLFVGAEYNKSEPEFTKLKVGASIPLRFSNINNGARNRDKAIIEQSEQQFIDTRLLIQSEVMQAYNECLMTDKQMNTFTRGMLDENAELLDSKRKAYRQGEISFIEFIETERSDNLLQEEYINTLFNKAASRVRLLQSVGINCNIDRKH